MVHQRFLVRSLAGAAVVASAMAFTACGGSEEASQESVRVFAAASLKPAGDELAKAFEDAFPSAQVEFNYGGSSDLVRQLADGAPADIFISADQKNMDKAVKLPDVTEGNPEVIATNTLELAVPRDNPAHIKSVKDLPGKRVALCAPQVPCGTIAQQVLDQAGVKLDKPSEEANVAGVSAKVATGEVDAGFIYSTDVRAQKDKGVQSVRLDGVKPNEYPMVLTQEGDDKRSAVDFGEWIRLGKGQDILQKYGFGPSK